MIKYLIRLDDACLTMNNEKWSRIERLLDDYAIRPMVGVIPHNEDPGQMVGPEIEGFWDRVKSWESKGWTIAMHGYNHCYVSDGGLIGLNPMWLRSEFSGLSLDKQKDKIKKGVTVLREKGFNPRYFFAPSHTYDENTLVALREESDIRIISDTIALKPYKYKDFIIVPQIGGHCVKMRLPGYYTFCFHPNVMSDDSFAALESFIEQNKSDFLGFNELDFDNCKSRSLLDKIISSAYFAMRRVRKIR